MPNARRLIVGLGNPGTRYEGTRHNVGYIAVDALADHIGVRLERDPANALVGWGRVAGFPIGLAKPLTYMNLSGEAVRALTRRYGLSLDQILIIFDDLNLPLGTIRLRQAGSAGGHNGVQDIIDRLGSDAFPRLRIGIGSEFSRGKQVDYVLSPFSSEQQATVADTVHRAREAALVWLREGLVSAMNRFNRQ